MDILSLPDFQLSEIIDYLSLQDGRHLLITCDDLRQRTPTIESHRYYLAVVLSRQVASLAMHQGALMRNLTHLECLTLGSWATDTLVEAISHHQLLPQLKTLSMVSSKEVTDRGLRSLAARGRENLISIDITFCSNTTFQATLYLRRELPNLELIRRQPEWMDGHFETPFENDNRHTYYADGSFLYQRETSSFGFVHSVFLWNDDNPNHIGDKLQVGNFDPPPMWPELTRYAYRPGVSVLRLAGTSSTSNDSPVRTVLVAQNLQGLRPPRDFPRLEHQNLPIGVSKYFSAAGRQLPDDSPTEDRRLLMTHMRLHALEDGPMPPAHLISRITEALDDYREQGVTEEMICNMERQLHIAMGGDPDLLLG